MELSDQGPPPLPDDTSKPARTPKRTSGALRQEHFRQGAFLVALAPPKQPMDLVRRPLPPGLGYVLHNTADHNKVWQSVKDKYETMQRKGFRVTADIGCLIADDQYLRAGTDKGHRRSFEYFARFRPNQTDSRNEYGWPSSLQISHLCHRSSCVRPDHLICEAQWQNLKRNYCGASGICDCGNAIKCLKRYQMDDQVDSPQLCATVAEVREVLHRTGAPAFTVHDSDYYVQRDVESARRMRNKAIKEGRLKRQAKHEYETARKQARLAPVAEPRDPDDFV